MFKSRVFLLTISLLLKDHLISVLVNKVDDFITIIENILNQLISSLEWVMLIAVLGGGIYLCIVSKLYPLTKIRFAFNLLLSKNKNKGISRFQALSAVLAATVGLGNISGVAIAIHMGGPGVLVWMWVTAIIGMIIKFYSCSLSCQYKIFQDTLYFINFFITS